MIFSGDQTTQLGELRDILNEYPTQDNLVSLVLVLCGRIEKLINQVEKLKKHHRSEGSIIHENNHSSF